MIIPKSIEAFYGEAISSLNLLKVNVDQTLSNLANSLDILYVDARIKPKESLMAKIEKEGCMNPANEIGDLVACRLITRSSSSINVILEKIEEIFNIEEKNIRNYRPNEFIYDDIQLVLNFKDNPLISNKEILGKKFELQIRTGLQDALAEVIRNETYKTDVLTWQKERTAGELRANLELVDAILSDFVKVSTIQEEKDYKPYQRRNEIITLLKSVWSKEKLPEDLRRASIIIEEYLRLAEVKLEDLVDWLNDEKYSYVVNAMSITPCQIIMIILSLEKSVFLTNVKKENRYILVTDEMIDVCSELSKIEQSYRVNLKYGK
jgi:ppGpp synthetase/RelA/SpoT-type nucleotidyltranferase